MNKVVAHLRGGKLVKGFTGVVPIDDPDSLLKWNPVSLPEHIPVRVAGSGEVVKVPQGDLKALFFVKAFEGRAHSKEVKNFETGPSTGGLWVRVKFYDNEWTEGVAPNSILFLSGPGFFLKPPDPHSNNEMVYVVKSSLVEFLVRGVRYTY